MAKKSRITKNKHKDFQKVRLKAGITKGSARRQADATKRLPFVKTRRIDVKSDVKHVPQKFHSGSDYGDAGRAGEKNSVATLIGGLDHANEGTRRHCLTQLQKLIQTQSTSVVSSTHATSSNLPDADKAEIVRKSARNLVDPSSAVAGEASKLLCLLCSNSSGTSMIPYCPAILSFIAVALTARQHDYHKAVKHSLQLLKTLMLSVFAKDKKCAPLGALAEHHNRAIAASVEQWTTVLRSLLSIACISFNPSASFSNSSRDKIVLNACSSNCAEAVEDIRLLITGVFGAPDADAAKNQPESLDHSVQTGDKSSSSSNRKSSVGFTRPALMSNLIFEPLPVEIAQKESAAAKQKKLESSTTIAFSSASSYQDQFLLLILNKFSVFTNLLMDQCRRSTTTTTHAATESTTNLSRRSQRKSGGTNKTKKKRGNDVDTTNNDTETVEYECLFRFFDIFESIIRHVAFQKNGEDEFLAATCLSPAAVDLLYENIIAFLKCVSESDVLVYDAPVEKDPLLVDRLAVLCDLLEQSDSALVSRMSAAANSGDKAKNDTKNIMHQKRELLVTLLQTIRKQQGKKINMPVGPGRNAKEAVSALNIYRSLLQKPSSPSAGSSRVDADAQQDLCGASSFLRQHGVSSLRFSVPALYADFDEAVRQGLEKQSQLPTDFLDGKKRIL